ncbi:MAG: TolC family protein [Saprospiraceae bacterium]
MKHNLKLTLKVILLATVLGIFIPAIHGQQILQHYVAQALQNNLQLKEKKILEHRQEIMLEEASRLNGPQVNFIGNYTLAGGGRNIDFPIGDLLNPVYSTLNDLTETHSFHQLENQSINFLPNNFYDAKFRITQSVIHPEIKYNKLIKTEELSLAGLQTKQAKRDLIRDVKTAYLHWMQANEAISIIDQGMILLNENKRITESLLKNGQAIPSALLRVESEIDLVQAQKQKAQGDLTNAANWFNFLLNQPAGTSIEADTFETVPDVHMISNVASREELQQIKSGEHIQQLALTLEQKHFAPKLGVQLDLGSQAFGVDWGGYALGGLQLDIPIWDNKQSKLKQQEWKASIEANQNDYTWTQQAFEVQLQAETQNLQSDIALYQSYTSMMKTNSRYYDETLKRYKEGLTNYIELLDARTEITNTQLQQNLAKYQAWIRQINIERLTATASID